MPRITTTTIVIFSHRLRFFGLRGGWCSWGDQASVDACARRAACSRASLRVIGGGSVCS
jgi:hypothetical protein